MGTYSLIIGGLRGHHEDLWPITGALRLLHEAAIDTPHVFENFDPTNSIKLFNTGENGHDWEYLKTFVLSEGGYLEIEKEQATWMFYDDIKWADGTASMLKNIFDFFKEQRDCGMIYIEECIPVDMFDEIVEGKNPPTELYNIETQEKNNNDDDDDTQPNREISFLHENYIQAHKKKKEPLFPMTVEVLEKKIAGAYLGYYLYGNLELINEWLQTNPSSEARKNVAATLLTGMDIAGVKAVLTESPGARAAETAIFPLQSFLEYYQPSDTTLHTVVYGLRKAQYELETIWPEASAAIAQLNKKYTALISGANIGLLAQQADHRLNSVASSQLIEKKTRKHI